MVRAVRGSGGSCLSVIFLCWFLFIFIYGIIYLMVVEFCKQNGRLDDGTADLLFLPAGRPAGRCRPAGRPACRPAGLPACRQACRPAGRQACRPAGWQACRPAGRQACRPAGRPAGGRRTAGGRPADGRRTAGGGRAGGRVAGGRRRAGGRPSQTRHARTMVLPPLNIKCHVYLH